MSQVLLHQYKGVCDVTVKKTGTDEERHFELHDDNMLLVPDGFSYKTKVRPLPLPLPFPTQNSPTD